MKTKITQYALPGFETTPTKTIHGGEHSLGKRKTKRPLSAKKAMHVVMRASRAQGQWSLRSFRNRPLIEARIKQLARKYGVRIYRFSINSNHIHILLRTYHRPEFQNFLRVLAGSIAIRVTGASKKKPIGKFWDLLAFSRIIEWGKAYLTALKYVIQNRLEADGTIAYKERNPRRTKLIGV